jgi:hypothetical protein
LADIEVRMITAQSPLRIESQRSLMALIEIPQVCLADSSGRG